MVFQILNNKITAVQIIKNLYILIFNTCINGFTVKKWYTILFNWFTLPVNMKCKHANLFTSSLRTYKLVWLQIKLYKPYAYIPLRRSSRKPMWSKVGVTSTSSLVSNSIFFKSSSNTRLAILILLFSKEISVNWTLDSFIEAHGPHCSWDITLQSDHAEILDRPTVA